MEVKLTIIVLAVMTLMVNLVDADFFFNHPLPKAEDIVGSSRYKCVPGRTTIKVTAKPVLMAVQEESDSEEYRLRERPARRTHMTVPTQDESCKVCVCSAEGKDEYCSNRPAESVNECLLLKDITNEFNMGIPYDHSRNLYNRIRRDYIWHSDEIPYSPKAKCFRGHSFYTNSITANDTDVDIGSDVESLLDYSNNMTCYFCICHTNGEHIACINRDITICEYYRYLRSTHNQDKSFMAYTYDNRPMYFRQLTYRLRRTMDNGIYDMLEAVDSNDILPKKDCVPFLSEYSDCNDDNLCSGCHECACNADGQWDCKQVKKCYDDDHSPVDELQEYNAIFDNALKTLDHEMKMKNRPPVKASNSPYVPAPSSPTPEDDLLAPFREKKIDDFLQSIKRRFKRSITTNNGKHNKASVGKPSHNTTNSSHNNTVKYYDDIDDLNEDTLKNSNLTGTLVAKKMDVKLPLSGSRRSDSADNTSKSLQIEYNQPKAYNQITDNKIEATEPENQFDVSHESLKTVFGNFTQNTRNNDLSKIVVNEMKTGSEVIGDAGALPVSNITFTSENDTLNAMAFIAGNLLNKLWNMEKEAGAYSIETEILKHDKISDLLDLFKEPLNLRQEMFLKNALEQLSRAIDKDKDAKNISICNTIQESEKLLHNTSSSNDEEATSKRPCRKKSAEEDTDNNPEKIKEEIDIKQEEAKVDMEEKNKNKATFKAIAKINNVLDLIKKFENIQGNLSELKHGPKLLFNHSILNDKRKKIDIELTKDEKISFNMFGSLLEKITNLILPKRNNKKIANAIKSQNFLKCNDNLKKKFKKIYNIDLTNMTMSAKDKIILDYLTHVDKNPGCLINKKSDDVETMPNVEGNVLLNLLEFMKLNSFGDLIKLIEPQKTQEYPNESRKEIVETTTKITREKVLTSNIKGVDSYKFNSTKEKLKVHLKTIMEDLIELQSSKGVSFKGNIKIEDALPCIYNLLKADSKEIVKNENIDPFEKVANAFQEIKNEVKATQSRRNAGDIMSKRPKSAAVWERLVKHLNDQSHLKNRRSSNIKQPKTYDKIKESMEKIEIGSSLYKYQALKGNVSIAKRLQLFKVLEQEVQAIINVIDDIIVSFENIKKMPNAIRVIIEITDFNSNMINSIKLNEKVLEKYKRDFRNDNDINFNNTMLNDKLKKKPILRTSEPLIEDIDKMKISRTQIVNQLIKNRMETFLKEKKASGSDVKQDLTYSIAQRILYYLDVGNYKLANELYKWIILQKQNETSDKYVVSSTPKHNVEKPLRRMAEKQKKAPVLLEDPNKMKAKHMNWVTQDHLIKQLLNIKNMGI